MSLLISSVSFASLPSCPEGHCSRVNNDMHQFCKDNNLGSNVMFPVIDPDGRTTCTCSCSCVAEGTTVELANGEQKSIEALSVGEQLLTFFGFNSASTVDQKLSSEVKKYPGIEISFSNGQKITASKNHPYVSVDETVVPADSLKAGDRVLDSQGNFINVTETNFKKYNGKLVNIILNKDSKRIQNHIYSTNDILSGDYVIQNRLDLIDEELKVREML